MRVSHELTWNATPYLGRVGINFRRRPGRGRGRGCRAGCRGARSGRGRVGVGTNWVVGPPPRRLEGTGRGLATRPAPDKKRPQLGAGASRSRGEDRPRPSLGRSSGEVNPPPDPPSTGISRYIRQATSLRHGSEHNATLDHTDPVMHSRLAHETSQWPNLLSNCRHAVQRKARAPSPHQTTAHNQEVDLRHTETSISPSREVH